MKLSKRLISKSQKALKEHIVFAFFILLLGHLLPLVLYLLFISAMEKVIIQIIFTLFIILFVAIFFLALTSVLKDLRIFYKTIKAINKGREDIVYAIDQLETQPKQVIEARQSKIKITIGQTNFLVQKDNGFFFIAPKHNISEINISLLKGSNHVVFYYNFFITYKDLFDEETSSQFNIRLSDTKLTRIVEFILSLQTDINLGHFNRRVQNISKDKKDILVDDTQIPKSLIDRKLKE
jgi:hypothetical protein